MFRSASANAPGTYRYVKQTVTGLAATTSPQLKQRARFQTSAMIRHLLFCDIMQQFLDCLTLEDGTTACPETLVNNHQYTLCNIPQQWGLEANYTTMRPWSKLHGLLYSKPDVTLICASYMLQPSCGHPLGGFKRRNTVTADMVKDVQMWSHRYNVSN